MIIEGAPAGSVGFWSKHLQRTDTNEAVHVREVRGTLAQDLEGALIEMAAVASGSRSRRNFMYQANINPMAHETLTPEQWREAIDTLEKNLGLEDHQRVVVEHVKDGRQHTHVIWNRVDVDTMRVCDMGGNFYTHERTARQLEQAFGLERAPRVHGEREGERVSKRTDLWEYDRGHASGERPKAIKAELTELWRTADNGPAFIEALEHRGYIFCRGDRRDFCVIDRAGDEHSLARRLEGVTAAQLRDRLGFVDRANLPSVAEAKELHELRRSARQAGADRDQVDALSKLHAVDRADNQALRANLPLREAQAEALRADATERREQKADARQEAWRERAGHDVARAEEPERSTTSSGVQVFDGLTKAVMGLVDFVCGIVDGLVASPAPKRTAFEQLNDDPAERVARIKTRRREEAALESIREDLRKGNTVSAADVRNLPAGQLQDIAQKGDAALLSLIRMLEEERARDRDGGRTRER